MFKLFRFQLGLRNGTRFDRPACGRRRKAWNPRASRVLQRVQKAIEDVTVYIILNAVAVAQKTLGAALVLLRFSQQTAYMSRSRTRIIQALFGRLLAIYSNATNVAQVTTCTSQQTQIVKLKIPDPEPLNPVCQIAHPQTS